MSSGSDAPAKLATAELVEYLALLGGDLLSWGCPTHRLEDLIRVISEIEGFRTETFAVPTGLFLNAIPHDGGEPLMRLIRVKEWGVNLDRLTQADRIMNDVAEDRLSLRDAIDRLRLLERRPPTWPFWMQWLAGALATGAAAVFFRGGPTEVLIAFCGGALLSWLTVLAGRMPSTRLLSDFLGGVVAAGLAAICAVFRPELSREVIVLAVVILNVPGMVLTTGLDELAHKNLVSGAARMMEAMIVFLSILFGIALVVGVAQLLHAPVVAATPRVAMALPFQLAALLVASLAFGVLFSVPRNFLLAAMGSAAVGWIATSLGRVYLPGQLSAFAAALALSLFANGAARVARRPAQLFLLPGLVLLVPGSFGFLSLEEFLRGDFVGGASKAFEMFLVAGALVTGLLVANVVLPAKKIL